MRNMKENWLSLALTGAFRIRLTPPPTDTDADERQA
jgi:hypothetical protein